MRAGCRGHDFLQSLEACPGQTVRKCYEVKLPDFFPADLLVVGRVIFSVNPSLEMAYALSKMSARLLSGKSWDNGGWG